MFSFKCILFQKHISIKDYIKESCLKKTLAFEPHISIEEKIFSLNQILDKCHEQHRRLLVAFFKLTEAHNVVNTTGY